MEWNMWLNFSFCRLLPSFSRSVEKLSTSSAVGTLAIKGSRQHWDSPQSHTRAGTLMGAELCRFLCVPSEMCHHDHHHHRVQSDCQALHWASDIYCLIHHSQKPGRLIRCLLRIFKKKKNTEILELSNISKPDFKPRARCDIPCTIHQWGLISEAQRQGGKDGLNWHCLPAAYLHRQFKNCLPKQVTRFNLKMWKDLLLLLKSTELAWPHQPKHI